MAHPHWVGLGVYIRITRGIPVSMNRVSYRESVLLFQFTLQITLCLISHVPFRKVILVSVKQGDETEKSELQLSWSIVGEVSRDSEFSPEVETFKPIGEDAFNELEYETEIDCCPGSVSKTLSKYRTGEASMKC